MSRQVLISLLLSLGATLITSQEGLAQHTTEAPIIKIERSTNFGEWEFNIDAAYADRGGVWVDWNNNQTYDAGEEVTSFGAKASTKFSVSKPSISIYGKVYLLKCNNNKIKSIDLSGNTYLSNFSCEENEIESLDLSKNAELFRISCSKNKIKTIKVDHLQSLRTLEIAYN